MSCSYYWTRVEQELALKKAVPPLAAAVVAVAIVVKLRLQHCSLHSVRAGEDHAVHYVYLRVFAALVAEAGTIALVAAVFASDSRVLVRLHF